MRKLNKMSKTGMAVIGAAVALIAACGATTASNSAAHSTPTATASAAPSAAEVAIHRAMTAECPQAQSIDSSVTAATTVGNFASGVSGWQAQLTAAGHIPMTGVPQTQNNAREIQIDFAAANFALALASMYDNPFGPHYSLAHLKRGYNLATSKLQDALNRCAAAGL